MVPVINEILVPTIAGAVGTAAFAVLYHAKAKWVPYALLGGAITTFFLVVCLKYMDNNNLVSNMIAAFFGGIYCILCAHEKKAPVPVFMIPTLFPLVPGRNLYFSMIAFVRHSRGQFIENFSAAAEISFGIAVGVMFANVVSNIILNYKHSHQL